MSKALMKSWVQHLELKTRAEAMLLVYTWRGTPELPSIHDDILEIIANIDEELKQVFALMTPKEQAKALLISLAL